MGINELMGDKRAEALRIVARHGAINPRVFGSFARGDADPSSDLDVLVETGPIKTPFFPGGLVADLSELFGRPVSVVTVEGVRPAIRQRILGESIPL